MISVFIDQMIYTHFQDVYPEFRACFRFPKLYAHTFGGMVSPSWLVYSHHGYDKKIDWTNAQPVATQLFNDCLSFLSDKIDCQQFLSLAAREIDKEFEPKAARKIREILSSVDIG